jgi:putative oxidoreductase
MDGSRKLLALAGRFFLALIFVLSGFQKLTNPGGAIGYISHGGIPHALIYPALVVSIIVELGLGLLLMIGYKARWVALLMFIWFIPVTIVFHFLTYREAAAQGQTMMAMMQQINMMKNISIMGGLLLVAAFGSGAYSLDGGV